jgi:hypothetical protein
MVQVATDRSSYLLAVSRPVQYCILGRKRKAIKRHGVELQVWQQEMEIYRYARINSNQRGTKFDASMKWVQSRVLTPLLSTNQVHYELYILWLLSRYKLHWERWRLTKYSCTGSLSLISWLFTGTHDSHSQLYVAFCHQILRSLISLGLFLIQRLKWFDVLASHVTWQRYQPVTNNNNVWLATESDWCGWMIDGSPNYNECVEVFQKEDFLPLLLFL